MDGILLIDKPKNLTSRDVVNEVSHILSTKKVGHTGTLDPMATGVLVLCVGKATKIVDLITSYDKEYIAEVTLGIKTDTLDIEGSILNEETTNINIDQIKEVLNTFIGDSKQEVPIYSAIKIKGKKLYEYARNNQEIELPVRDIHISELKLISNLEVKDNHQTFKISCSVSKGTYIRSLIRDIGKKLNTIACMSSLERTKQGSFTIDQCYTLDDVKNNNYKLINIKEALSNLPFIKVNEEIELKIRNGAIINKFFDDEKVVVLDRDDNVIAIYQTYEKDNNKVKPYKMFI